MPFSVTVETNFPRWAKRKLKHVSGEVVCFVMFVIALWAESVLGFFRGMRIAYIDWQDLRYALNYRKRRE